MRGATNIAPMITAVESKINPKVAIMHERTTNKKKSKPGEAACSNSSKTSTRLSGVKKLNQRRILIKDPQSGYSFLVQLMKLRLHRPTRVCIIV